MKAFAGVVLCTIYVAAIVGFGSISGPVVAPWIGVASSVLFLLVYWRFIRQQLSVPLVAIFVVTVIFPFAILFAIGLPFHHSWLNTLTSLVSSLRVHGQLGGLELFLPLFAAIAVAIIVRRRSNKAIQRTPSAPLI